MNRTHSLRILVVDDEPGMRLGVGRALRDFTVDLPEVGGDISFEVLQAESGEAGLSMVEAHSPDILLLDHKLPGLSGLDVLERLSDQHRDMFTVMITAYASLETAVTATKRGAYDFLAKPFTPGELRAVVRKTAKHLMLQREARRLAEEKRRVRFEFISVLAHELKAPLAAIEGYLRLMRDRTAGDTIEAYDRMVNRSLVRLDDMRKLIFDLLDMTRIESGTKRRDFSQVDLRATAERTFETFQPAADERRIALELVTDGDLVFTADQGEVDIILNNLVSNAVKYNRDEGRVTVRLSGRDDAVTIAVTDTGIGMSADETARLFGEFVRIKNERTRGISGSGLGLSTLKKLAQLYGGTVTVTSEPEVGSTFTIVLARSARPAPPAPAAEAP